MKTRSRSNSSAILASAIAATLLIAGSATAAPSAAASAKAKAVFNNRGPAANVELPSHAKANSGTSGALDTSALDASTLNLTLADGRVIEARLQRVSKDDKAGRKSWVGTVDSMPGSMLVLTRHKGIVTGFANYGGKVLELQPSDGTGQHLLFEVDNSRLPQGEVVRRPQKQASDAVATPSDYGLGGSALTAADNVVQDVLVVYSAASAARYGQATLEGMIQSAVEAANQAYQNSQIAVTLNPVGVQQTSLNELSSMDATVTALQTNQSVAQLRDQLGADLVIMVSENSEYCGLSNLMTSNSTSFAPYAFGVVYSACLSNQSLAHELGHQQGVMHDRDSSPYGGVYPYSYGYRVCASDGTGFRDIMSYSCSGAPRVLLFSNPNVNYNGHAAGVSYEMSPSQAAENARSLNNTAATVAAFRSSGNPQPPSNTTPAAPSGLSARSVAYNQVSLGWLDNANNESGFKLERSSDGVAFTEVATLGADTSSYTDGSVNARSTYYYRLRAYNSAGSSGFSNAINVTTPDAPPPPPPPPTAVAAADNADGSATVSWSAASGSATSFEVMRESYDSRRKRWRSATTVGTVPSSVSSLIDASGSGTFRYSVRSSNASGRSAYAGPAQVNVTGGGSSSGNTGKGGGRGKGKGG